MSEMIERVARAIQSSSAESKSFSFDELKGWQQNVWRKYARAAIEAMREPTLEMKMAGFYSPAWSSEGCIDAAAAIWEAMIDEALK